MWPNLTEQYICCPWVTVTYDMQMVGSPLQKAVTVGRIVLSVLPVLLEAAASREVWASIPRKDLVAMFPKRK